jgi:hypothetical protein
MPYEHFSLDRLGTLLADAILGYRVTASSYQKETKMPKLREMSQLLRASILALAMLFITLDMAAALNPASTAPTANTENSFISSVADAMPGRKLESAILASDATDNQIIKAAD